MIEIPLGQKESETFELKGRDSLKDLFSVGREVVAMLNAQGGEIWVGLREEQGRAVLVEAIERPELERQRLRDYLADSIEPRLSSKEVQIEEVPDETGQAVLRLAVSPEETNRPYALLEQNARYFLKRLGGRLRLMSREEIFGKQKLPAESSAVGDLAATLATRDGVLKEDKARLWVRVAPVETLEIDLPSEGVQRRLRGLLTNPEETNNRPTGLTFVAFTRDQKKEPSDLRMLGGDGEYSQTVVAASGAITSWVGLRSLVLSDPADRQPMLNARYLLEYPTSVLRLARTIYQDAKLAEPPQGPILVDFAITGLSGQRLKPHSPSDWGLERRVGVFPEQADFVLPRPLQVSLTELADGDRVAFRLIRQLYAAFGFSDADIPREFDRKTGRLVLPE